MTQDQLNQIEAVRKQMAILTSWWDDLVKDCDHKYPDGKNALITEFFQPDKSACCSICYKTYV